MLIEVLAVVNLAVAGENPSIRDAFTGLTQEEKRGIYLETITEAELEQIERNTERLTVPEQPDPYWCYYDDDLFAVVIDTCGPEPK